MRQYFIKALGLAVCMGLLGTYSQAQDKAGNNDEIIIRKKSDKDAKVTVEIHGNDVIVNGKPLSDFEDADIVIRKRSAGNQLARPFPPAAPQSPFRGGTTYTDEYFNQYFESNGAFLGVSSSKDDKGAKVENVTRGSAAEKAGLKEGDVITRVNDNKIETPADLTKVINKFKTDEKVNVTYLRNNKEMKAIATLGKRQGNINITGGMNLDDLENKLNLTFDRNSPKIGIKAQDTEESKGVKVIGVDDGSNAQKAGIKEGDVLTEFDGKSVNSAAELADAARNAKDKNNVKVKLSRNGKQQELEIKIPKKLRTATL